MGPEAALFSDQPVMPHRGLALPVRNWVVAAGNMFQCSLWLGWWTVSMLSLVGLVDCFNALSGWVGGLKRWLVAAGNKHLVQIIQANQFRRVSSNNHSRLKQCE
jgi:hypothetical protein